MNQENREFLSEKIERRVELMLERIGQPSPATPWLPSGSSYSSLRRTAARLRAGVIRPLDPRISPVVLAEMIEKAIVSVYRVSGPELDLIEGVCGGWGR